MVIPMTSVNPNSTGQRIRRQRRLLGMTQRELGKKLGVTDTTVWMWEKDRARVSLRLRRALCQVLCLDMQILFGDEEDRPRRAAA